MKEFYAKLIAAKGESGAKHESSHGWDALTG